MRYTLAFVCPPLALRACGKPRQAIFGWVLYALAFASGNFGVVIGLHFLSILWAWAAVGHQDAQQEAQEFIHAVRLSQSVRRFRGWPG